MICLYIMNNNLTRGGGGHFHWRPYQMLEKKCGKGVSKSGVGAEERVSKSRKMGGKGIKIRVQAVGLYVERIGNLRQHVTLILTSNQRQKTSALKPQIRVKAQKMTGGGGNAYTSNVV